jgi:hypothetical protein
MVEPLAPVPAGRGVYCTDRRVIELIEERVRGHDSQSTGADWHAGNLRRSADPERRRRVAQLGEVPTHHGFKQLLGGHDQAVSAAGMRRSRGSSESTAASTLSRWRSDHRSWRDPWPPLTALSHDLQAMRLRVPSDC